MVKPDQNRASRTTEEYIILSLSGFTALVLFPFVVLRFFTQDWLLGILDFIGVFCALAVFVLVYTTHNTRVAGKILAAICCCVLIATIELKGSEQLSWCYPALTALFFLLLPRQALVLSLVVLAAIGLMILDEVTVVGALRFYLSAIATVLFSFVFAGRMRAQQLQLVHQASNDPLTGAGNRRALEQKLLDLMSLHRRHTDTVTSLIMFDIDRFKCINDRFGHATGDDILVGLIQVINQRIRTTDQVYRLGGEEFVVIAEQTPLKDAVLLAETLRTSVENDPVLSEYNVTVSVGTAQYAEEETAFEWLGRADKAMYRAKNEGRNSCCVA